MSHTTLHRIATRNAQWNQPARDTVQAMRRQQGNQNKDQTSRIFVERVISMGSVATRTNVLAQIFSPSGRVHVHHTVTRRVTCFPQSVCWRFSVSSEVAAE